MHPGPNRIKNQGIAVICYNQLIAEKYLNGYTYQTNFQKWSIQKVLWAHLSEFWPTKENIDWKSRQDLMNSRSTNVKILP